MVNLAPAWNTLAATSDRLFQSNKKKCARSSYGALNSWLAAKLVSISAMFKYSHRINFEMFALKSDAVRCNVLTRLGLDSLTLT